HVDLHLRRFEKAIVEISDGIKDPVERAAFVQYATWKDLRELRALSGPLSASKAGSRRHELRIIVDLLTWVRAHGETLATLSQGLVDQWM
ncbi:hypothetical protein NSX59_24280, partial [Salmonella enterica]|nr:hypothetical protein [Salmonella enterica]